MEQLIIRGRSLNVDFAKSVSKRRFCEIYKGMKPRVIEEGWNELLEATGRTETPSKKVTEKKKGKSRKS